MENGPFGYGCLSVAKTKCLGKKYLHMCDNTDQ